LESWNNGLNQIFRQAENWSPLLRGSL